MQRKTESEPRTWRPYVLVAVAVVVLLALAGYGGVLLLTPQWVSETGESRPDVVADRFASLVAADDGPSPGIGGAASPRALGPRSGTITLPKLSVGPASGKGARSGVLAALSAGASRSRIDAAFAGATGGARSRSGVDTGGGRGVGMAKGGGLPPGALAAILGDGPLGGGVIGGAATSGSADSPAGGGAAAGNQAGATPGRPSGVESFAASLLGAWGERQRVRRGQGAPGAVRAGALTAGDWDDNLNFDAFLAFVAEQRQREAGTAVLPARDRVVITVLDAADAPVSGARVTVSAGSRAFLSAPTGSDGRLLFFPERDGATGVDLFSVTIEAPAEQGGTEVTAEGLPREEEWTFVVPEAVPEPPAGLDLALVVDTTGSMGDELAWLQAELAALTGDLAALFPGRSLRFSLVVYRDREDEYVVRSADFTADPAAFVARLGAQAANGGGDTPEAADLALEAMHGLSWREGNVARVALLVADAPPHEAEEAGFLKHVERARRRGIRLYPVAASGVGREAELLLRQAAQATLARYVFLTDDSGIGGGHAEPHIPCYHVQRLDAVLARVLVSELTGRRVDAPVEDVIRSVGQPVAGVCALREGRRAYL